MSQQARNNPDQPPMHEAFAGGQFSAMADCFRTARSASKPLPGPFTAEEWNALSLSVGWTVAMADTTTEGMGRRETSMKAMKGLERVLGDGFHWRIADAVAIERGEPTPGSSSDIRHG